MHAALVEKSREISKDTSRRYDRSVRKGSGGMLYIRNEYAGKRGISSTFGRSADRPCHSFHSYGGVIDGDTVSFKWETGDKRGCGGRDLAECTA